MPAVYSRSQAPGADSIWIGNTIEKRIMATQNLAVQSLVFTDNGQSFTTSLSITEGTELDHASVIDMATAAVTLAKASEMAYSDPSRAMKLAASTVVQEDLIFLRAAVMEFCATQLKSASTYEIAIQEMFFSNLNLFLPGSSKVKGKRTATSAPDGWVLLDGAECPVEVKINFTKRSLLQLKRYMNEFGCTRGVAVARKFSVDTPPSIIKVVCDKKQLC